jgi:uncharacterized membrane protein YkgB
MAKKPAPKTDSQIEHELAEVPPAMDYAQHNATYEAFLAMVKWGIVAVLIVVVALYCFIEAHQPVLGTLLLLVIPVGAVALAVTKSRVAA